MPTETKIDDELKMGFEQTYEAVAFDLQGFEDDDHTISRDALFEICCDYLGTYGDLSEDTFEYWQLLSSSEKDEYKEIVFTYTHYEVGGA